MFATFNPVAGSHAKVVVGTVSAAINCTLSPAQKAALGVFTVTCGNPFTTTETSSEVSLSPVLTQVVITLTFTVCVGIVEKVAAVAPA
ncbi:hypothetical protein D3C86_1262000 [compost metagenome]